MSAGRGAPPRPALVQEAYHAAELRLQEIRRGVQRSAEALRLDAQEEYGVITRDEYADRVLALEEAAGWPSWRHCGPAQAGTAAWPGWP